MSNNKHIQSKKITELEDQIRALQEFVSLQNDVIAQKDEAIARNDRLISEKDRTINNLDADNLQLKHQLEQLKRMLFGSKSERFIPQMYAEQLTLDLFPKPEEIEEEVDKENEKIRVEYERKKAVKKHPGRMT